MQKNKHIIITGATRGLGRALTEKFIELGHFVSGCGRSDEKILELNQKYANSADFTALDITSSERVTQWSNDIVDKYGVPDIIINNAAIINQLEPFHEVSADVFNNVIDINVKGIANVLRAFIPFAKSAKKGIFINMSSGWGRFGAADVATYCASKGAVEMLTASIAKELTEEIAIMTLSPGGINTDMTVDCSGSHNENSISANEWAELVAPQILKYDVNLNGKVLSFDKECELQILN